MSSDHKIICNKLNCVFFVCVLMLGGLSDAGRWECELAVIEAAGLSMQQDQSVALGKSVFERWNNSGRKKLALSERFLNVKMSWKKMEEISVIGHDPIQTLQLVLQRALCWDLQQQRTFDLRTFDQQVVVFNV